MKNLIVKLKKIPLPLLLLLLIGILWLYPFIESSIVGASDWSDLSTTSNLLMIISVIPFAILTWKFGILGYYYIFVRMIKWIKSKISK